MNYEHIMYENILVNQMFSVYRMILILYCETRDIGGHILIDSRVDNRNSNWLSNKKVLNSNSNIIFKWAFIVLSSTVS